jgi:hypothetical protein
MNLNIIQIIILNVQKCKKAYFVEKGRNRCTIGIFSKEGDEEYTKYSARTYGNNTLRQSLYLTYSAGYFSKEGWEKYKECVSGK